MAGVFLNVKSQGSPLLDGAENAQGGNYGRWCGFQEASCQPVDSGLLVPVAKKGESGGFQWAPGFMQNAAVVSPKKNVLEESKALKSQDFLLDPLPVPEAVESDTDTVWGLWEDSLEAHQGGKAPRTEAKAPKGHDDQDGHGTALETHRDLAEPSAEPPADFEDTVAFDWESQDDPKNDA